MSIPYFLGLPFLSPWELPASTALLGEDVHRLAGGCVKDYFLV